MVLNYTGDFLTEVYCDENYQQRKNDLYIKKMQEEITKNELSIKDAGNLIKWIKKQEVIFVRIYNNNSLVLDSEYPIGQEVLANEADINYYERNMFYSVEFADGKADVSIVGLYNYQISMWLIIAEVVLSFVIFLLVVMFGIKKIMCYIQKLSEEIEILEGGNLDYEITVSGTNELSALAAGLDNMRKSFKEKNENEAYLIKVNQRIITEMSHDLRTPLTSVMLYSELLSKGKYTDEKQFKEYAKKINKTTVRLKQLTDNLFEYALISSENEVEANLEDKVEMVFYDLLSELCEYLEQNGFRVETSFLVNDEIVKVHMEYINRIFDNIASNIIKYADNSSSVKIDIKCINKYVMIGFQNFCGEKNEHESNNIGINNIKNMMKQMGGECHIEDKNDTFTITLCFPCK